MQATGIPAAELRREARNGSWSTSKPGSQRLRALRRAVHQVLHQLRLPGHGASGGGRLDRRRRAGGVRARIRGRASPRRDRLRAGRVVPGVPGGRAPDAPAAACARRHGRPWRDGRRPGRLPGHPRLPGACALRGHREHGRASGGVHREPHGRQERRRGGADPRERQMVRARAQAAPGVQPPRGDRGTGKPESRARGDAGHVRGARPGRRPAGILGRRVRGYRGQIGLRSSWAHAVAHNIEFRPGDVLVTETSAPSGATTPSSSARW